MATHTHAKPAGTPTWIDLLSPDLDASRAFYEAVFGWTYDIGGPEFGGYTTARLGALPAAGIAGQRPGDPPAPAAWQLYFASDSAETDARRAVELGAQLLDEPVEVGPFGTMAHATDPTGATFCLWQANMHVGSQITDEPGAPTWYELYTPDAKAARDFYAGLLNASVDTMPGGLEYYVLRHGEKMLAGIMQIDPSWGPMPAQWVTYFTVADADETVQKAVAAGGTVMGGIDPSPFGRLAALRDPAGATFKILQPNQG